MDHQPFILIVDDENDFPEIIGAKLSAAGMTTAHAKKRDEAIAIAEEKHPDLVLMDINMPEVQGPEILLDLKQNEKTKTIKVLFLTNSKEPWPGFSGSQADVAKELGAADFLQKTEDLDVLLKKIQAALADAPASAEAVSSNG